MEYKETMKLVLSLINEQKESKPKFKVGDKVTLLDKGKSVGKGIITKVTGWDDIVSSNVYDVRNEKGKIVSWLEIDMK